VALDFTRLGNTVFLRRIYFDRRRHNRGALGFHLFDAVYTRASSLRDTMKEARLREKHKQHAGTLAEYAVPLS